VRVAVTPEEPGLCGAWQVIALERTSLDLTQPDAPAPPELGCYVSSLTIAQADEAQLLELIRGHWSAIENGTHYRRDVILGEDACRTQSRPAAAVLASLRNLAIGAYELARERGRTHRRHAQVVVSATDLFNLLAAAATLARAAARATGEGREREAGPRCVRVRPGLSFP